MMNIKPEAKKPEKRKQPRPPKKITETYLHNSGLYYLQRFAASSAHFRQVMLRKVKKSCHHHKDQDYEQCSEMVNALVEKFISAGLLDDEAYTKGVINSLRRGGKSRRAVMTKMKIKGLPNDMVTRILNDHDTDIAETPEEAERHAALIFARKKRIGPFTRDKETPHEKALASMARAGFSYDTCRFIIEMDTAEAQDKILL